MIETSEHLDARESAITAFVLEASPREIAVALNEAADRTGALAPQDGTGATSDRVHLLALVLRLVARLYEWDAAVRDAEADADRHLRAAHRGAEIARETITSTPDASERHAEVLFVLDAISQVTNPADAGAVRAQASQIQLPLSVIREERRGRPIARTGAPEQPASPRVVCLLYLDGALVEGPVRVRPDKIHRIDVLARVLNWLDDFETLRVEFVSIWGSATVEAPQLTFERPEGDSADALAVEGQAQVILRVASEEPITLTMQAELASNDGRSREIEILGYSRFALRPFDPTLDAFTGAEAIDERLHEAYGELKGAVPDAELTDFASLLNAVARAARAIQGDNVFRKGRTVSEADFQDEMERRVKADPTLGNEVQRIQKAGGITDLTYRGISCELKVEPTKQVDLDYADAHIGQPVQYGSGAQKQLSILCVLDMSPKTAPAGALAGNIALRRPEAQGGAPPYVAVVIIPGNLDVPSAWSGTNVAERDKDG